MPLDRARVQLGEPCDLGRESRVVELAVRAAPPERERRAEERPLSVRVPGRVGRGEVIDERGDVDGRPVGLEPVALRRRGEPDAVGQQAAETQAAIRRILLLARFDEGVLLLVVADMVLKPFS